MSTGSGNSFLRTIKGCNRWDIIRNTTIRRPMNMHSISNKICGYRIKWRCHLNRMEDSRLPQKWHGITIREAAEMLEHRGNTGVMSEQHKGLIREEDNDNDSIKLK